MEDYPMKRIVCCLTAAVFSLGLFACAAPVTPDTRDDATAEVVVFDDDVLEALVREAIGKPEGEITVADALGVTELDMQMQGVDPDQRISIRSTRCNISQT
jgi:hypothetical protein